MFWKLVVFHPVDMLKPFIYVLINFSSKESLLNSSTFHLFCGREYEGVSKSFRTESITNYTLTLGIIRCCSLHSIPLSSLCESGVSATAESTAGTDFFESRIGRSPIVPEFQ